MSELLQNLAENPPSSITRVHDKIICPTQTQIRGCAFAQELIDQIIDYLHDDVEALRRCSLVAHSWLPTSSLHLSSRIQWPYRVHVIGCTREGGHCYCRALDGTFQECLHCLSHSPRVIRYLRRLTLCGDPKEMWWDEARELHNLRLDLLVSIVDLFSDLRRLVLDNVFLGPADSLLPSRTEKRLDSLTIRFMRSDQCFSVPALLNFLRGFHTVTHISIINATTRSGVQLGAEPLPEHHNHVDFLELIGAPWDFETKPYLDGLRTHLDMPSLTSFTVQTPCNVDGFLATATNLYTLKYTISSTRTPVLIRCTHLHTVTICGSIFLYEPWRLVHQDWPSVMRDLESVAGLDVRRVVVEYKLEGVRGRKSTYAIDPATVGCLHQVSLAQDWSAFDHLPVAEHCRLLETATIDLDFGSAEGNKQPFFAALRDVAEERLGTCTLRIMQYNR